MPRILPTVVSLALCLGLSLAGACKTEDGSKSPPPAAPKAEAPAPQAPAPQAPAPQAPAPQAAFRVTRIDLGNAVGADKRVTVPSYSFKPNDTIYALIFSEGTAPSVTLATRWTFEDGQLVNEATQTIAPTGPAVTEFHIAKPDGWPAGKYKLEIVANGTPSGALEFTVVD